MNEGLTTLAHTRVLATALNFVQGCSQEITAASLRLKIRLKCKYVSHAASPIGRSPLAEGGYLCSAPNIKLYFEQSAGILRGFIRFSLTRALSISLCASNARPPCFSSFFCRPCAMDAECLLYGGVQAGSGLGFPRVHKKLFALGVRRSGRIFR